MMRSKFQNVKINPVIYITCITIIVLFQACRGDDLCDSVIVGNSSVDRTTQQTQAPVQHRPETYYIYREIPLYQDCILAYSAPPGTPIVYYIH